MHIYLTYIDDFVFIFFSRSLRLLSSATKCGITVQGEKMDCDYITRPYVVFMGEGANVTSIGKTILFRKNTSSKSVMYDTLCDV